MPKAIKIIACVIAVVLLAGLTLMIVHYRQDQRALSSRIAALSAEARPYEAELTQLKREQEIQELNAYETEDPGVAVIAFRVGGETTLETARELSGTYGIIPSILVNVDDPDVEGILAAIADDGPDIIFGCERFTDATETQLRAAMEQAEMAGCPSTGSFLLRASADSEANRRSLYRAGVRTLFLYGDDLSSDVGQDFLEMSFSYVNRDGYNPASRLSQLEDSEQGLLFAVDLVSTTVTEKQLQSILSAIRESEDNGRIVISTVDAAERTVRSRVEREQERIDEYMADREERNARITELETTIRDIYDRWDDP